MIERCAKALWDDYQAKPFIQYGWSNPILFGEQWNGKSVPWEHLLTGNVIPSVAQEWRDKAILVFKAMRKPTEKMSDAGCDVGPDRSPEEYYQAMIDVVINEQH